MTDFYRLSILPLTKIGLSANALVKKIVPLDRNVSSSLLEQHAAYSCKFPPFHQGSDGESRPVESPQGFFLTG